MGPKLYDCTECDNCFLLEEGPCKRKYARVTPGFIERADRAEALLARSLRCLRARQISGTYTDGELVLLAELEKVVGDG